MSIRNKILNKTKGFGVVIGCKAEKVEINTHLLEMAGTVPEKE